MSTDAAGVTNPAAGVIATRPATAPSAAPSTDGVPRCSQLMVTQVMAPMAAAVLVVTKAVAASPLAPSAEPALNPNQPNHSRPAPSTTSGRLCGFMGSLGQPTRLPSTIASARPAAPALMCTAVPPAKSIARSLLAIQPPGSMTLPSASLPSKSKTQCATGKYTIVAHRPANSSHGPNRARSAMAPEISATVMIANIAWNATNTVLGILPASESAPSSPSRPKNSNGLPSRPPPTSAPNAVEYPNSTQRTPTTAIAPRLILILLSTLFERTMPP